jgi:hypothetical protein
MISLRILLMFQPSSLIARLVAVVKVAAEAVLVGGPVLVAKVVLVSGPVVVANAATATIAVVVASGSVLLAAAATAAVVEIVVTVFVAVAVSSAGSAVGVGMSGVVGTVVPHANGATYLHDETRRHQHPPAHHGDHDRFNRRFQLTLDPRAGGATTGECKSRLSNESDTSALSPGPPVQATVTEDWGDLILGLPAVLQFRPLSLGQPHSQTGDPLKY